MDTGVVMGRWAWGSRFVDINNDGWEDLVVTNGFITQADGQEIFVHYRNITGDGFRKLKDGQEVEFELVEGDKGLYAENVRPLG